MTRLPLPLPTSSLEDGQSFQKQKWRQFVFLHSSLHFRGWQKQTNKHSFFPNCPQEPERAAGAAAGVAPPLTGHGEGPEPWRAQGRVEGEGAEAAGRHQEPAREAAPAGEDTQHISHHLRPLPSVGAALTALPRLQGRERSSPDHRRYSMLDPSALDSEVNRLRHRLLSTEDALRNALEHNQQVDQLVQAMRQRPDKSPVTCRHLQAPPDICWDCSVVTQIKEKCHQRTVQHTKQQKVWKKRSETCKKNREKSFLTPQLFSCRTKNQSSISKYNTLLVYHSGETSSTCRTCTVQLNFSTRWLYPFATHPEHQKYKKWNAFS